MGFDYLYKINAASVSVSLPFQITLPFVAVPHGALSIQWTIVLAPKPRVEIEEMYAVKKRNRIRPFRQAISITLLLMIKISVRQSLVLA